MSVFHRLIPICMAAGFALAIPMTLSAPVQADPPKRLSSYDFDVPYKYYDEIKPLLDAGDAAGAYALMMDKVRAGDPNGAQAIGIFTRDGINTTADAIEAAAWFMVAYKLSPDAQTQSEGRYELKKIVILFSPKERLEKTARVKDRAAEIIEEYYADTPTPTAHIDKPETYDKLFSSGDTAEPEDEPQEKAEPQISLEHVKTYTQEVLLDLLTFTPETYEAHLKKFKDRNSKAWSDLDRSLPYAIGLNDIDKLPPGTQVSAEPLTRPVEVSQGPFEGSYRFVIEQSILVRFTDENGNAVKTPYDQLATVVLHCADEDPACEKLQVQQAIMRGTDDDPSAKLAAAESAQAFLTPIVEQVYNVDLRAFESHLNALRPNFSETAWAEFAIGTRRFYKFQPDGLQLFAQIIQPPPYLDSIARKSPYRARFTYILATAAKDPDRVNAQTPAELLAIHATVSCSDESDPCEKWQIDQWLSMDYTPRKTHRE